MAVFDEHQNVIMGAAGAGGGYTIDQSIRFNDDDSAYLNRTPASDGNRQTMTFSWWMKRGNLDITDCRIFTARDSNDDQINFKDTSDYNRLDVFFDGTSGGRLTTSRVFRDVSAWYHCVVAIDTTQATSGDRVKIYVNGDRVTDFDTETQPTLNKNLNGFNNNGVHAIGARGWSGAAGFYDGYMAEIHFIDGQQLAASDFGETNTNGVWVPIEYTGTYGTNGFYITGADSADLGADDSGNGNDFTSSGLTASSQVLDTPTDNYCVMNENVQNRDSNITNSDGIRKANLQIYRPSASTNSFGSGTMAVYGGAGAPKLYYECYTSTYPAGNVLQMYIEDASSSENVQPSSFGLNQRHTTSAYRLFIYPDDSETPGTWTSEFGEGVYVGLAVDFANDEISANVDGTEIFSYNSTELAALTGITIDTFAGRWWRPKIQVANDAATIIDVNFGQNAFQNAPAGYVGWSTSAIPTPTVKDGSAYFQTTLYTGTGAALEINQTGNSTFQPDFVWAKSRSNAQSSRLADAVRGSAVLFSDSTASEDTTAGISFDSDGFSWTNTDGSNANDNTYTYAAWQWLAGNGTASNSDGSITSTVSVNTTAGFSIVSYTGTGSAATVGHGLGVAPYLIIAKNRSTTSNWSGYHVELGATKTINLNENVAAQTSSGNWNNTEPTTSVFSVNTATGTNGSGNSIVAYCFAEVEGFSKFGSYTGNGSADGPFVHCGFKPAFLITKVTNTTNDWVIWDSTRDPENVAGRVLRTDSSNAEFDGRGGSRDVDFVSNGFKFRSSNTTMNTNGNTYIFIAFAEHPFGGDGIAPITAR